MYSSLLPTNTSHRSTRYSITFCWKSHGFYSQNSSIQALNSASVLSENPRIWFERDRKRRKPVGAMTGEYGGCGSISQPRVLIASLVILAIWGRVVTCSKRTLCCRLGLLNSCIESVRLSNIEFRFDRLISFKHFVRDNPWLECRPWIQTLTVQSPASKCFLLEQETLSALLQSTQLWNEYQVGTTSWRVFSVMSSSEE